MLRSQLQQQSSNAAKQSEKAGKDTYVGVHSSGFRELLLRPELLRAIVDCGFEHPSEVQHECIPEAILGNDILCQAKSGMGKTAVFVLSVLQQLDVKAGDEYNGVQTLVMCHTRELAFQICHEFDRFKKYLPQVRTAVFYGGINIDQNVKTLKDDKPHIVIGTPGRVLALVDQKMLDVSKLKQFVLDECDKMLEQLDMRRDIQRIFKATPHEKQVMMFSATLSAEVRPVCKKFMHNPHEIYVNEGAKLTLHGLQQYYVQLEESAKNRKLVDLLDALEFNQLIIFVKSVPRATALNKLLVDCNFPSIAIHGSLKQEQRYDAHLVRPRTRQPPPPPPPPSPSLATGGRGRSSPPTLPSTRRRRRCWQQHRGRRRSGCQRLLPATRRRTALARCPTCARACTCATTTYRFVAFPPRYFCSHLTITPPASSSTRSSRTLAPASWSPRISWAAASTSSASTSSSTTTAPRTPTPTCTASAVPAVSAPRVSRSASSAPRRTARC